MTAALATSSAAVLHATSSGHRGGYYPGSKNGAGVAERIISLMPRHRTYVAGFAGHDAIFFKKRIAEQTIVIDVVADVAQWWREITPQPAGLEVIHRDFVGWARSVEARRILADPATLLYLDPPYLRKTRRALTKQMWPLDMDSEDEHRLILDVITPLKCMVMISGYYSTLYAQRLATWRSYSFQTKTHRALATEYVWLNFPAGLELHDVSMVGEGWRERQRIRRRKKRWVKKFQNMPPVERQVIREALEEFDRHARVGEDADRR